MSRETFIAVVAAGCLVVSVLNLVILWANWRLIRLNRRNADVILEVSKCNKTLAEQLLANMTTTRRKD